MQGTLQFITDPRPGETLVEQVESVLAGGVRWVQLRAKNLTTAERLEAGRVLQQLCRRYRATFIVNDDIEVARELGADGIHLGLDDPSPRKARKILGPEAIIGGTCNTFDDIRQRANEQVDYIGVGPFRTTTTKKKLSPTLGLAGYNQLLTKMHQAGIFLPVIAIGGIRLDDVAPLMETAIHGIAVSSLIIDSADRSATITTLLEKTS